MSLRGKLTPSTHASVRKAGEMIGYEPSRTISEGEEFIEWYQANREWYEPSVQEP